MTGPSAVQHITRPLQPWEPPLSGGELATVLNRLRSWTAFDGGALLDDVAAVLDDVPPPKEDSEQIAEQLRGHLVRLATIAVATEAAQDTTVTQLLEQARTLRVEDMPNDYSKALGQLRRMGWTASELLDRLVAMRCLKEVA
ncbi:hypothetical protein GCM10010261_62750 [Streptomyces pilosus]|uniref:DUF6415 family natural product biosynthesis protein n=1 Tax=Streptomyces pilosus TaxID=28893 RepID=UPI00167B7419|nr:DUF6415 family natural product biosynthesis protein [Streptomyces pilosus]GGV68754.1 hypothetical protein GCM10010261_62750 [Streptomyces pilosus]